MAFLGCGYESYEALRGDARALEDVLIAMAGERDASRIRALEAKHHAD